MGSRVRTCWRKNGAICTSKVLSYLRPWEETRWRNKDSKEVAEVSAAAAPAVDISLRTALILPFFSRSFVFRISQIGIHMKHTLSIIAAIFLTTVARGQQSKTSPNKDAVIKSVDKHKQELIGISDKVWAYAETALRESKSSKELADYAEAHGCSVKRGV